MIVEFGPARDEPAADARLWDLCIVGAGAAGLALAAEFLGDMRRVVVLESGLHQPDEYHTALNVVESSGLRHDGASEGRVRAFGGTTRSWGGQLVPMRPSEVTARPWLGIGAWPVTLEELQPYYRRAERLLRTEGPPYDESLWPRLGLQPPPFDGDRLCVRFSQWASLGRRNFAVLWRRQFARSQNVHVLLGATAVAVRSSVVGAHCEAIEIRARSGRTASIRARRFVIACGGIENARLLLASPGSDGTNIANRSGTLGRFFQDHVSYAAGEILPRERRRFQAIFDPRYIGNTMYSVKLEPTDASMRSHGWLNAMGHVAFQIPDSLGWLEVRRLLRALQSGRVQPPSFDETLAIARGSLALSKLAIARFTQRRRRSPATGRIMLMVDCEQAPNPESRITLDGHADALGVSRARLDWRVGELERRTLLEFARLLAREFERLGLGQVRLASEPSFHARDELGAARDIFHHMGTTRMSRTPDSGVTRPDLRCHDVDNLFVVGSSVFPTSGIANPTFTIIALALRLADHLKTLGV
jgi:choline dehydrogenase-like flavoprotein